MSDKVHGYWNARATESAGQPTATTNDVWLRELEIATICAAIREVAPGARSLLDAGCGDGYSTLRLADAFPGLRLHGVDYSAAMVRAATERLSARPELAGRVEFRLGDVTALSAAYGSQFYDVVVTDRCLINLPDLERQSQALGQIADCLEPGGHYICVENFIEGHDNMNAARRALGLPEIPVRWHNVFFKEAEFLAAAGVRFEILALRDFASSYYFATRVIYSKVCQIRGEEPDYDHDIHRLAGHLPWIGQFSPVRMAVLRSERHG
jgi:ubiquinone/menaquinone biosynthesis C-methylase UbiE